MCCAAHYRVTARIHARRTVTVVQDKSFLLKLRAGQITLVAISDWNKQWFKCFYTFVIAVKFLTECLV